MHTHLSWMYKNEVLSDVKVQIWNLGAASACHEEPTQCPKPSSRSQRPAKRQKPSSSSKGRGKAPADADDSAPQAVLVEEFPGHKAAFCTASSYFRAMVERWEQPEVNEFKVKEEDVSAAQALVHYVYHGSLPDDEDTRKVLGNVITLADRYEMVDCIKACAHLLESSMEEGRNAQAALEAIALLTHIMDMESVNLGMQSLLQFFTVNARTLHRTFQKSCGESSSAEVKVAADVLFSMFHDMDKVWVQEKYRNILYLFPAPVIKVLMERDDLVCMSENTIATAISEWILAQISKPFGSAVDRNIENDLLVLIRAPFLSPGYRCQVFPNLPWIVKRNWRIANDMLLCANFATASALSGGKKTVRDESMIASSYCEKFDEERQYTPTWQPFEHVYSFKWTDIKAAGLEVGSSGQQRIQCATGVWYNGVCVCSGLILDRGTQQAEGGVSLQVYLTWDFPIVQDFRSEKPYLLAEGPVLSFWNEESLTHCSKGSDGMDLSEYHGEDKWSDLVHKTPSITSYVYQSLSKATMKEYAKDNLNLMVKCCIRSIQ